VSTVIMWLAGYASRARARERKAVVVVASVDLLIEFLPHIHIIRVYTVPRNSRVGSIVRTAESSRVKRL